MGVSRRSLTAQLRWVIVLAMLLVFGAGVYYTAPEWKARVRQWIDQLGLPDPKPSDTPIETSTTDSETAHPDDASIKTTPSALASDGTENPGVPDIPLRTPPQPPDISSLEPVRAAENPVTGQAPKSSADSPAAGAAASAISRPDPGDAVEWVLKNRQQEKSP